jgi:hypothetical protein
VAGALAGVVSVLVAPTVIVDPVAICWPEGSAVMASLIAPIVTTALPPMIAANSVTLLRLIELISIPRVGCWLTEICLGVNPPEL